MRYWMLTGILLVAFLLQSVVSHFMTIGQVSPDFLLALVVTYGLLFGWEVGLAAGIAGGLLVDSIGGLFIGRHVLAYGLVGLGAGLVEGRVFKDNFLLPPVAGLLGSMVSQTTLVLILWLFGQEVAPLAVLRTRILPAALYDMVITVLAYSRIYRYYLYLRPDPRGTIVIRRH